MERERKDLIETQRLKAETERLKAEAEMKEAREKIDRTFGENNR